MTITIKQQIRFQEKQLHFAEDQLLAAVTAGKITPSDAAYKLACTHAILDNLRAQVDEVAHV